MSVATVIIEATPSPGHRPPRVVRTPLGGTTSDQLGALRAAPGALRAALGAGVVVVVVAYSLAIRTWEPVFDPTPVEMFGTWTSLACVWLTRRQNVLSMPFGIVSVIAMGAFFFDIGLVGQGWLHLGFYVPVQIGGW